LGGDPSRLLQRLDASPHQLPGLLLAGRAGRVGNELLGCTEPLSERGRQIFARADGLRQRHLDGAPAATGPDTGRPRRVHQRSLIPTRLALSERPAPHYGSGASAASAVIGGQAHMIGATVAGSFPLSAETRGRGPDATSIRTGVPLAPAVEGFVLGD